VSLVGACSRPLDRSTSDLSSHQRRTTKLAGSTPIGVAVRVVKTRESITEATASAASFDGVAIEINRSLFPSASMSVI